MFKPDAVAFDFETSGLDFWSPDFKVLSAAMAWRSEDGSLQSRFIGPEAIEAVLQRISDDGIPLVVHNLGFEYGVIKNIYPRVENIQYIDTQRLAQVYDNGGARGDAFSGFGLAKCVQRILAMPDPKAPYYEWLRENGVRRGQEGANLDKLPEGMFKQYNRDDAINTLALYVRITDNFKDIDYNWQLDHDLYTYISKQITDAQGRGVRVDREALTAALEAITTEIDTLDTDFRQTFKYDINALESQLKEEFLGGFKTEKTKEKYKDSTEKWAFNLKSTTHLKRLFIDVMGMEATFTSPKGAPSFKASHLPTYGAAGKALSRRNSKLILKQQITSLLKLSETDGRWHLGLKAVGTATGRFAGTGGLNAQGLARREKLLMGGLVADPGHTFVSIDLSSGEPTATCHYSGDKNYADAIFNMVGQDPYFDSDGVFKCDDIYLSAASFSPLGASEVRRVVLSHNAWDGKSLLGWDSIKDSIKAQLKEVRDLHKILVLGIGYSMGPRKMVQSCKEKGFDVPYAQAKQFFDMYWAWCHSVKSFSDAMVSKYRDEGHLINDFGYRLLPDADHKCFNYWIQSSVSGIMNILAPKFFSLSPESKFVTVIHDELIIQVPDDSLEQAKDSMRAATYSLNRDLGWDVKVRTGWVEGGTLYEAK